MPFPDFDQPADSQKHQHEQILVALRDSSLFAQLDPAVVANSGWQLEVVLEGALLFEEGDQADAVFVVISGVLGLFSGPWTGQNPIFRKVFRGDLVGEYALLCGEPRSASAVALTPVEVVRLERSRFDALLSECPNLQRPLVQRLALQASRGRQTTTPTPTSIVVCNADPGSSEAKAVMRELLDAVRQQWHPHDGRVIEAVGAADDLEDLLIKTLETRQPTLCVLDGSASLSMRNCKLIDRLVLIVDGANCHHLPDGWPAAQVTLVRAWPMETGQLATAEQASLDQVAQVINVRAGDRCHMQRLMRCLLGLQNVLVLGGGGARGFAHIGVLQALEEQKSVDIDMVLGVSFGSLVASLFSFECTAQEVMAELERVIIRSRPYAPVLSRQSLFSLDRSYRELKRFFGEASIHDSWRPFQAFSTNLTRKRLHAWNHGDLCTAVIASMSIPGLFRPVVDGVGDVHVDGGVLDNLPVQLARSLTAGQVIAVTLDSDAPPPGDVPSIAKAIVDSMMCSSHGKSAEQENVTSLMLRPDVCSYSFLDWRSYRKIYDAGYACGTDALGHRPDS